MTTPPAIYQYDSLWHGGAHRNFCIPMKNGKATLKVDGMPDYQLYFVSSNAKPARAGAIFAEGLETPGKIDIDTPDEPHTKGDVCLGIAN
jgi:hypothetical protein